MKIPFLLGRVVFGGFFLYSGINHFVKRREMAQYTAAKNVPLPDVAVTVTGAMEVVGGISILLGVQPKWGAAAIAGFLAGVTPIMHDFWRHEDPQKRQADEIHFMKNMALLGAALALGGVEEPWPLSVLVRKRGPLEVVKRRVRNMVRQVA